MRREQKRAERRRTIIVITACAVVALVIIGLAAVPLLKQSKLDRRCPRTARCGAERGRLPGRS